MIRSTKARCASAVPCYRVKREEIYEILYLALKEQYNAFVSYLTADITFVWFWEVYRMNEKCNIEKTVF